MAQHTTQPGLEVVDNSGLEVYQDKYYQGTPQGAANPGLRTQEQTYSPVRWDPAFERDSEPQQPQKRKILGLRPLGFWALIVSAVVVVAVIVGSVVGTQAARSSKSRVEEAAPSSTPSPSAPTISSSSSRNNPEPTQSSTANSAPAIISDGGCPGVNGTTFTPRNGAGQAIGVDGVLQSQSFARLCNTNHPSGEKYGNPGLADIAQLYAPSLDECMTHCAQYNAQYGKTGTTFNPEKGFCRSVAIVKRENEFCYLKNGTGLNNTMGAPQDFASAVLLEDPMADL